MANQLGGFFYKPCSSVAEELVLPTCDDTTHKGSNLDMLVGNGSPQVYWPFASAPPYFGGLGPTNLSSVYPDLSWFPAHNMVEPSGLCGSTAAGFSQSSSLTSGLDTWPLSNLTFCSGCATAYQPQSHEVNEILHVPETPPKSTEDPQDFSLRSDRRHKTPPVTPESSMMSPDSDCEDTEDTEDMYSERSHVTNKPMAKSTPPVSAAPSPWSSQSATRHPRQKRRHARNDRSSQTESNRRAAHNKVETQGRQKFNAELGKSQLLIPESKVRAACISTKYAARLVGNTLKPSKTQTIMLFIAWEIDLCRVARSMMLRESEMVRAAQPLHGEPLELGVTECEQKIRSNVLATLAADEEARLQSQKSVSDKRNKGDPSKTVILRQMNEFVAKVLTLVVLMCIRERAMTQNINHGMKISEFERTVRRDAWEIWKSRLIRMKQHDDSKAEAWEY